MTLQTREQTADGDHVVLFLDTAFRLACDQITEQYDVRGKASETRRIERTDIPHILLTSLHHAGEHLVDEMDFTGEAERVGVEQECEAVAEAFRKLRTPLLDHVDGQIAIGHVCISESHVIEDFERLWFDWWPGCVAEDDDEDEPTKPLPRIPIDKIGSLILKTLWCSAEWLAPQWNIGHTEEVQASVRLVCRFFSTLTLAE